MSDGGTLGWYGVRCVVRLDKASGGGDANVYEERVTIWRAGSFDEAIAKAESEISQYVTDLDAEYIDLAQAYRFDPPLQEGAEVFSLTRNSELEPKAYLDRYFDDGNENQKYTE